MIRVNIGVIAHLVERVISIHEAPRAKLGYSTFLIYLNILKFDSCPVFPDSFSFVLYDDERTSIFKSSQEALIVRVVILSNNLFEVLVGFFAIVVRNIRENVMKNVSGSNLVVEGIDERGVVSVDSSKSTFNYLLFLYLSTKSKLYHHSEGHQHGYDGGG